MRIDIRIFNEQGQLLYQSVQAIQNGSELTVFPVMPLGDRDGHARLSGLKITPLYAEDSPHSFDLVTGRCERCGVTKQAYIDLAARRPLPPAETLLEKLDREQAFAPPLSPAEDAMLRAIEEAPGSVFLDAAVEAAFVKKLHPSHDWQRAEHTPLVRVCTRCGASEVVTRFDRGAEPCPAQDLPEPDFEIKE